MKGIKRVDLEDFTGKPDMADAHPLIACAPHIEEGHAHLKHNKVRLERVLSALKRERRKKSLILDSLKDGDAVVLTDAEVRAVFDFTIDTLSKLGHLYAEMERQKEFYEGMAKNARLRAARA